MPDYNREPAQDDLDIAARVMDTVQRQIGTYRDALTTLRRLRTELADRQQNQEPSGKEPQHINTPQLLAEFFEENGIPKPLSTAMAVEDFAGMEGDFPAPPDADLITWTWDCCCSSCCFTCSMATQVTGCSSTFVQ